MIRVEPRGGKGWPTGLLQSAQCVVNSAHNYAVSILMALAWPGHATVTSAQGPSLTLVECSIVTGLLNENK